MKVAIGLILSHGFPVPTAFLKGVFDWYGALVSGSGNYQLPEPGITQVKLIYSEDFPVDAARNDICREFLDKSECEYLVFLDADMRHPAETVHRLVSHGQPLVSGRYQMRRFPFKTVAMTRTGDGPRDFNSVKADTGLVPIDAAGAGVLAIHRDVLVAIRERVGDDWFKYGIGPNGLRSVSEDMHFFEQAKAAGFQAYCDLDLHCTHVGQFEINAGWAKGAHQAVFPGDPAVAAV